MKRIHLVMAGIAVLVLAAILALVSNKKSATAPDQLPGSAVAAADPPATGAPATRSAPAAESGANTRLSAPNKPAPPQHKPPKPAEFPTAQALPDREGFVLSPYNNKIIDVRGIQSGTLVADPGFPPDEKKFFRIP